MTGQIVMLAWAFGGCRGGRYPVAHSGMFGLWAYEKDRMDFYAVKSVFMEISHCQKDMSGRLKGDLGVYLVLLILGDPKVSDCDIP